MIDAYDVLGIPLDAKEEDIKKAYKRLSLQHHPDKVQAAGRSEECQQSAGEKFNEIKLARDILQDAERRKIYDTFGIDLGEERPEMEVWTMGLSTMLTPVCYFVLKTIVTRMALWLISFRWCTGLLLLLGVVAAVLYFLNFSYREFRLKSPEGTPILVTIGIVDAVAVAQWIWPLLGDTVGLSYLIMELVGGGIFLESWKYAAGGVLGSLILARLFRGWWLWIIGLEVLLAIVMLAALTVAAGMIRLWLDTVQQQRSEQLRDWRLAMRRRRKQLEDEVAELKRKLQERDGGAPTGKSGR